MTSPAFDRDERRLLDDSVQSFLADRYPFEHFRQLTAPPAGPGFDRQLWSEYARMGWLGIALPPALGGAGGGLTELAIVLAAAGRHLALEPFVATLVLGAGALHGAGTAAQRETLRDVVEGRTLLALCHFEPAAGFARSHVHSTAVPTTGGFRLDGEKGFTLHAQAADHLIVSARMGGVDAPVGLFLVAREARGVQLKAAPAIDGRRGAAVAMHGVQLSRDALLGAADEDRLALIDGLLDRAALAVSAEAAGAMAAVTERTMAYLKSREQFGQPLASFQVLQHRLVDMTISAEETRAGVHAALAAIDANDADVWRSVAMAKVQAARAARFVGTQAVQLHGGMGMTDALEVGHYYKRLMLCESQFGDAGWHLARMAATVSI